MSTSIRTRTLLAATTAAALLSLSACGGDGDSGGSAGSPTGEGSSASPDAAESGQPQPDLEGIPEVVAEVNGEEITREEFVVIYESRFQQAAMQAQMGGGEAPDEEALKKQTADGLVDTELLRQEAADRDLEVTDEQVDDKLTELAQQNQLESAEAFLEAVAEQGTPEEQVREQVGTQVLIEDLVADEAGEIEPTEKQLRTLYEDVKQQQAEAGREAGQKVPPFDKVRSQLEEQVETQELGKVAQRLLGQLREGADITVNL